MNYEHLTKMHNRWKDDFFPYIDHSITVTSFDDYLKKMSFLPPCKWLRDLDQIKILRIQFACDPSKFAKHYQEKCVAYCSPARQEDGFQRIIYQISPTLHVEAAYWSWVENENAQAHLTLMAYFHDTKEFTEFLDTVYEFRCTGNTEDKPTPTGFAGFAPQKK